MNSGYKLSIIVPTYNERHNIAILFDLLNATLSDISWELIVVDDDSPDKTYEVVNMLAQSHSFVRCVHRIGRRGLAGACIEGMLSASAQNLLVMDADLQHDHLIIPLMLEKITSGSDIVIGSRYCDGGSASSGFSKVRLWGSKFANWLGNKTTRVDVTDSMSGFFMIRKSVFDDVSHTLSMDGFKLLMDILSSVNYPVNVSEIPYNFKEREYGESKLDSMVTIEYFSLLLSKLTGGIFPVRFLLFGTVGATGLIVHLLTLKLLFSMFSHLPFSTLQLSSAIVAMTWNFVLNNSFTYRDRRLKGFKFFVGLLTFYSVCGIGTIANVGAASVAYDLNNNPLIAGLAGALVGSVFNYVSTSRFTWKT